MAKGIAVDLDKDQAFSLLGFLARHVYDGKPLQATDSEELALRDLCEALDNELVERFRDDYLKFVKHTRGNRDA